MISQDAMETKDDYTEKLALAKKRLKELKLFYVHFAAYIVVNLYHTFGGFAEQIIKNQPLNSDFWDFGTIALWVFWGIGLFFHSTKVFGTVAIFGKGWEEKKIQKYIEKEKREAKNFTDQ